MVVTGASAGIGVKLLELPGSRGDAVVGPVRREQGLSAVMAFSGADALAAVGAVTARGDHQRAVEAALAKFGRLDARVNTRVAAACACPRSSPKPMWTRWCS